MRIGLFAPISNPFGTREYIEALGRGAEERGFHELWIAEHVVLFDEYASKYPYADDGRVPAPAEAGFLDPFDTISFLAALTTRIRLGTGICLVPQRNPVYTAKEVTSVDWLSNGRFDFGVGVGWLAEEFQAVATPFAERGARTRAYLEVMKRLWCDPVSSYDGRFYSMAPTRQYPKPIQQPHPPIYFGGESDAALRRVADLGQGWYPFNMEPGPLGERVQALDRELAKRGRARDDVSIVTCPYMKPCDLDAVKRYRDIGVEQVIILLMAFSADDVPRALDELAESMVVPAASL